jgi:hypothetical protein
MVCLLLSKGLLSDAGGLHRSRKARPQITKQSFKNVDSTEPVNKRHRREDKNAF